MRHVTALAMTLALGTSAVLTISAQERLFPFPMEGQGLWRLRDGFAPAGENGFISAKGHRFVDGKGNVRRFLGVNLYGSAQMPTKEDAEKTAKQLSFWGFNAVRVMPQYTWQKRADGDFSKGPDPELLDRFDYFFAKLKERGLYVTMNLHSARTAGYRFKDFKQTMKENKGLDNFDPTFIAHQKEWDRFVFEHVNPYTGLAYKDDPAVLSWEINNECSLGVTWFQWDLWKNLTPPFKAELSRQFCDWLRVKYGTTEGLRTAWRISSPLKRDFIPSETWRNTAAFDRVNWYTEGWNRSGPSPRDFHFDPASGSVKIDAKTVRKFAFLGAPLDEGELFTVRFRVRSPKKGALIFKVGQHARPYASQGINRTFPTGPDWQEVCLTSSAVVAEKTNRVQIEFKKTGDYEIAGLSFVCGGEAGLAADESLEAANVQPVGLGSPVRAKDVADFILDVEDRYWKEMVRYLKEDLKAKQLVNGGTINYGAGYPQAYADFIDEHYYYGGLANFPGGKWSRKDWNASNRLMVLGLDDTLAVRGFDLRVFGKPYTISEASQMHQAATAADFFPILLSLSAFQDHAAIHTYTWTHLQNHAYSGTQWLDMHGNAKYLAHFPAARNMFVRGDVKDGFGESRKIVYELGRLQEREQIRKTGYASKSHSLPTDPLAMVKAVTGLRYTDLAPDPATADVAATPYGKLEGSPRRAVSSTGEIVWDATDEARAFYVVDTPRTKFLSQFGPAGTEHRFADGTAFTLGDTLMGWAAISLTVTATNQFLLAATGWQQPTGAVLTVYGKKQSITPNNAVKLNGVGITSQTAMGDVPFICEGVRATIRLPAPPNRLVRVSPLDGNALPVGDPVDYASKDGFVTFEIGERFKTVWYRVEFRERRRSAARMSRSGKASPAIRAGFTRTACSVPTAAARPAARASTPRFRRTVASRSTLRTGSASTARPSKTAVIPRP